MLFIEKEFKQRKQLQPNEISTYQFETAKDLESFAPIKTHVNARLIMALWSLTLLDEEQKLAMYRFGNFHSGYAEMPFTFVYTLGTHGYKGANNKYHDLNHFYQVNNDSYSQLEYLATQPSVETSELTPDVVAAVLVCAPNHDRGYTDTPDISKNYAAHLPIHVKKGTELIQAAVELTPPPSLCNSRRVTTYAQIAQLATAFPCPENLVQERSTLLSTLSPTEQREAQLVTDIMMMSDLGGQVAVPDYVTRRLALLHYEFESFKDGLGNTLIGTPKEQASKAISFINDTMKPILSPVSQRLFNTQDHAFSRGWERQLTIARRNAALIQAHQN